jgi:signal transduction histidine kinase
MLDGNVAGRVWSFRDVTAAKRAEESLRWRTALFEALVESALDGILVVDRMGRKILQNERMAEVWRIPQHLAGREDNQAQFEFIAGRTRDPAQFADRVAYLYSHPTEISQDEVELVDGTILDRYSAPVLGRDGRYYGRIWTFRDITAQRHLEHQFRQSQKMEAFGQLAGGVAHDFNNVLAATLLEVEIMESSPDLPSPVREGLEQIRTSTERAASLTRQLLLFSRRQVLQTVELNVNEVVTDLAKMLQRIIGEDLELVLALARTPLQIKADRGMVEQVLLNLAVNARDAMPQGGRLRIETGEHLLGEQRDATWPDATPGAYVLLAVTDTGTGIPPEVMPRIFDPFFTTKDVGKGTGLGLATVFGIVRQHHGWIHVENQQPRGVRFEILLPATQGGSAASVVTGPVGRAKGSETILLVEDEDALRRPIRAVLQQQGYRVLEAGNAGEALEVWQREGQSIKLLFTDLVMPGLNGQQLARQLQTEKPGLKVIFTSGYSTGIAGRELELQRGERFVQKPMRPEQLLDAVRAALDEY